MSDVDNALNELALVLQQYQVLDSLPEVKVAYFRLLRALAKDQGALAEQQYWDVRLKALGAIPKACGRT